MCMHCIAEVEYEQHARPSHHRQKEVKREKMIERTKNPLCTICVWWIQLLREW